MGAKDTNESALKVARCVCQLAPREILLVWIRSLIGAELLMPPVMQRSGYALIMLSMFYNECPVLNNGITTG